MGLKSISLGMAAACFFISSSVAEDQSETANPAGWGHVRGRVVLELELDDPRLKKHLEDLPLARPLPVPVPLGAKPELVKSIPNKQLVVDAKTKGVKNALVFLAKRPERVHPKYEKKKADTVKLTYAERQFQPRAFSLRVGQTLEMISDEAGGEPTNFHSRFTRHSDFNILVRADGNSVKWSPKRSESGLVPAGIRSDIHRTAIAFCLIKDHPYTAVTDAKGHFELKHLPAGTQELVIWHETVGWVTKSLKVTVNPDKTTTLKPAKITGDLFAR